MTFSMERTDFIKRLRAARANGDPEKYIAMITVWEAHAIADRLETLIRERDEAREANRKLHRRSQFVEGMYRAIKFDLEMWVETLSKPHWDSSRWLFDFALRHMERSISRCDRKSSALADGGKPE